MFVVTEELPQSDIGVDDYEEPIPKQEPALPRKIHNGTNQNSDFKYSFSSQHASEMVYWDIKHQQQRQ